MVGSCGSRCRLGWGGRGALGRDDELVQALLQSNARVDAADSDGCDPACDHRSRFHGFECLWLTWSLRHFSNLARVDSLPGVQKDRVGACCGEQFRAYRYCADRRRGGSKCQDWRWVRLLPRPQTSVCVTPRSARSTRRSTSSFLSLQRLQSDHRIRERAP